MLPTLVGAMEMPICATLAFCLSAARLHRSIATVHPLTCAAAKSAKHNSKLYGLFESFHRRQLSKDSMTTKTKAVSIATLRKLARAALLRLDAIKRTFDNKAALRIQSRYGR